jgi:hypothetical protein
MVVLAGCDRSMPTRPSGPAAPTTAPQPGPPPATRRSFEVSGIVTDEGRKPIPAAVVTMAHYAGEQVNWPSVPTDASGSYRTGFTTIPLANGFVARAQVVADGYEDYWRSLRAVDGATTSVETFGLNRRTRMTAGESIVLAVPPDLGECRGWVAASCAVVRITTATAGRLTLDVVSNDGASERPTLEICCESGDEVYGNPVVVTVAAGAESVLFIAVGNGLSTGRSLIVTTTLERR